MNVSKMSERELLEQLVGDMAELKTGQKRLEEDVTALRDGQARLEVGQESLNKKVDFVTQHASDQFVAIRATQAEHTATLAEHTVKLDEHTELLDTIAAVTGANTSDLQDIAERQGQLEKVHR